MLQYKYATLTDKLLILLGVILAVFTGIAGSAIAVTCGTVMNVIIDYVNADKETDDEKEEAEENLINGVNTFAFVICGIGIAAFIATYLSTVFFNYTASKQLRRIRLLYFEKMLNQDIPWYDVHQTGDFASRMATDIKKIEEGIAEKISLFIFFQSQFASSLIMAFYIGWELAVICLIGFFINVGSITFLTWVSSKLTKQEMDAYGNAGAVAEEAFSTIRTIVAFGGQQKEKERYDKFLDLAKNNNIRRSFFMALSNGLMWCFTYSGFSLAFWYGAKLMIRDRKLPEDEVVYDPGTIMIVFTCVLVATYSFGMATPYLEIISIARGAAEKIYSVIENAPIINASKGVGKKLNKIEGKLTFKDVHFSYPSRPDIKVLQGFNLVVEPAQTVALIGSSGCGKSTCIQLIQRFYDPTSGEVFIDNNNLKAVDLIWLREHIGVVGQEPVLFENTIAENIKLGLQSATQDDIEEAAKKANIHTFIKSLPHGYQTTVGERGAQLSGGQKQRIAIARALIRKPSILLLDEATSALDTNSEAIVQATLEKVSYECTTIIVAHRLSTIRKANRIVVIKDGKVMEDGTHDQLMESKGDYYELVNKQITTEETATPSGYSEEQPDIIQTKSVQKISSHKLIRKSVSTDAPTKSVSTTKLIWFILKLNHSEKIHIILGCIGAIIAGSSIPSYSVIYGAIIGIFVEEDSDYILYKVDTFAMYFLILAVAVAIATIFQMHMFGISGEKLSKRLRSQMFEKMLMQEMEWFDQKENGVGSLCAQLSGDTTCVQGAAGSRIGMILNSLVTIILSLGISLYFEWRLSLVALCFSPLIVVALILEQKILVQESIGDYKSLNRSSKIASEAIGNIRTVASLGSEKTFYESYLLELTPFYKTVHKNIFVRGLIYAVSRNFAFFPYCATFYYGAILVRDENLDVALIITVIECLLAGSWSVANATAFTPNLKKALISAGRIFKLLNPVPNVVNNCEGYTEGWIKSNVNYEKIRFSYPTRKSVEILKDLNLAVPQDKMIGLVGPSGCGKSTIIQLLERFYDPNEGKIVVNEKDIKTMSLRHLRSHLGIVSQEPNLFNRTIAENIAYGDNERDVSLPEIVDVAKQANIHDFITSLPLGYETPLGEKGVQLSGGQKQRVAIARALIRNPKILLLDEATSALDAESEKIVQEALDNAKRGRTCLTIAHRLTTIQDADIIYTINQGKVIETGTHSELINKRGLYYNLYNLQSGMN